MSKPAIIAIDGPAGAGKSTVARLLARQLGYLYVDSGAMYRAAALNAGRQNVDPADEPDEVAALTRSNRISFAIDDDGEQRVLLNQEDVTEPIRTPEITRLASLVSAIPGVRAALVMQQQALGAQGGVVMEGRDIGTVVFPNADLKIFLTAHPEERAERRLKEMVARTGDVSLKLDAVLADQEERDQRDSTRTVSPLIPAPDARMLDSAELTPEEVVDEILDLLGRRERGE